MKLHKSSFYEKFPKIINSIYCRTCEEFENKVEDPSHHNWTIQVLRSIDSDGCHFSNVDRRRFLNVSKQGQLVDDTIYRSLIWQIRNAKRCFFVNLLYLFRFGSYYSIGNDSLIFITIDIC